MLFWILLGALAHGEEFCLESFAKRTGSPYCWARYELPGEEWRSLCLRKNQWRSILSRGGVSCLSVEGGWKAYREKWNIAGGIKLSIQKKTFWVFRTKSIWNFDSGDPSGWQVFKWKIENWREDLSEILREHDSIGVLRLLLLHESEPTGKADLLRQLGFVHVFSATGIHLYAMARVCDLIVKRIAVPLGISVHSALWIARFFAAVLWILAWVLSGFRLGFLRPWIIVWLRSVAQWMGFRWTLWSPLILALGLDLLYEVFQILSFGRGVGYLGRVYYALAVGGGLMSLQILEEQGGRRSVFKEHFALSVGSWVPAAIFEIGHAQFVALATPLLSLITIPILTLFVFPVALVLSVFEPSGESLRIWSVGTNLFIESAVALVLQMPTLWHLSLWSFLMGGVLALLMLRCRLRVFVFCFLAIFLARSFWSHKARPRVVQLDVGQGDAALVWNREGIGMIDTGSERALSPVEWIKILASWQVFSLDWVALTHLDEDHAGGLKNLVAAIPVSTVRASKASWRSARGVVLREFLEGADVALGSPTDLEGVHSWVLAESSDCRKNRCMVGYVVSLDPGVYVNLGDASARTEMRFVERMWYRLSGPVILKLSHHGSAYSTPIDLIRKLRPLEVWISAGSGNPYGHPSTETLARFREFPEVQIRRTDQEGYLEAIGQANSRTLNGDLNSFEYQSQVGVVKSDE